MRIQFHFSSHTGKTPVFVVLEREFTLNLIQPLLCVAFENELVELLGFSLLPLHFVEIYLMRIIFVFGEPISHIDIEHQICIVEVGASSSAAPIGQHKVFRGSIEGQNSRSMLITVITALVGWFRLSPNFGVDEICARLLIYLLEHFFGFLAHLQFVVLTPKRTEISKVIGFLLILHRLRFIANPIVICFTNTHSLFLQLLLRGLGLVVFVVGRL